MNLTKTMIAGLVLSTAALSTTAMAAHGQRHQRSQQRMEQSSGHWYDGMYADFNLGIPTDFRGSPSFPALDAMVKAAPTLLSSSTSSNFDFGMNVNVGKMFTQNFGVEEGYTYLPGSDVDQTVSTKVGGITSSRYSYESTNHILDIAFKGVLPLQAKNISIFGKIGPALVITKEKEKMYSASSTPDTSTASRTSVTPAIYLALGASYNFSKNFSANVALSGVTNSKSSKDFVESSTGDVAGMTKNPALMLVSAGLSYKFA